MLIDKVSGLDSVTRLQRTPILSGVWVRCESKNAHKKTCVLNEIGVRAHDLLTILRVLRSIVNIIEFGEMGGTYMILY